MPDQPPAGSVPRRPPAAAIAAALLALVSALVPAAFALVAVAFSGGSPGAAGVALIALPLVVLAGLLVGAVLLLLGRSWLPLALSAALVTGVVLFGLLSGGLSGDDRAFALPSLLVPGAAVVLAVLPGVRRWVAARRAERVARP
ncbi:hypothetical protein OF117_20330 [Geodermatophilus sp. YIM 151500]|uniref:hypothetical protein n=1 Tax=Geodermatophilus sp. YIM 151500 TaxID=2984531 RepID=UPI0021E379DF|nr:hypothetical protein [Geodermatophilus sp. YIM 151500]MCV2491698.1 hypothetical protein [Geodermatophilus sp. YIM 151500]